MSKITYTPGQTVFYAPGAYHYGRPQLLTVETVGRKYVTFANSRLKADLETDLEVTSSGAPGRFYQSESEYQASVDRHTAWTTLRSIVQSEYLCPDGLTTAQIEQITGILKGNH